VSTFHTLARAKAETGDPEPELRVRAEAAVIGCSDAILASCVAEVDQLVRLYGADPQRVSVVHPGVDLQRFTPGDDDARADARAALQVAADARLVLFVGRIQPLKAPDVLLRAAAALLHRSPQLRRHLVVAIVGGPSGSGLREPESLVRLARDLGIADVVRFEPPAAPDDLVQWYRAADLVAVPSYSESFGLVALEAQACGTPVLAADVGGLRDAVSDGRSGLLVPGHDADVWADHLGALVEDDERRAVLARGAVEHAAGYGWDRTVDGLLEVYRGALAVGSAA
jgi:D-inositol-3-phosphate glycosyltransferase